MLVVMWVIREGMEVSWRGRGRVGMRPVSLRRVCWAVGVVVVVCFEDGGGFLVDEVVGGFRRGRESNGDWEPEEGFYEQAPLQFSPPIIIAM